MLRLAYYCLFCCLLGYLTGDGVLPMGFSVSMFTGATAAVLVYALPSQGRNPRPLPHSSDQARAYELELIDEDEESELRAVHVEFFHRPLTADSIAKLESEIELVLRRNDEAFSRVLAGGRSSKSEELKPRRPHPDQCRCEECLDRPMFGHGDRCACYACQTDEWLDGIRLVEDELR